MHTKYSDLHGNGIIIVLNIIQLGKNFELTASCFGSRGSQVRILPPRQQI